MTAIANSNPISAIPTELTEEKIMCEKFQISQKLRH